MTARRGTSRFVGNTTALGVATVATAVLTLLQVKILAVHLPRELFGLFAALRGLSVLVALLAANGLPHVLVRYLPELEARGQRARALGLSAAAIGAAAVLGGAGSAVVVTVDRFLRIVPGGMLTNELLLWFSVLTTAAGLKIVLYGGFNGLRRLGLQTVLEVTGLAVQVAWLFSVRDSLSLELLIRIVGTVTAATVVVGLPVYAVRLRRDVAGPAGERGAGDGYGRYWVGATGLSLVAIAFSDVDRYVLSAVLTLEMLSLFHVATRVVRMANRFLAVPVLAYQPEATRLDAEGRPGAVVGSARVFFKFSVSVSLLVAAAVAVYARDVILVVASPDYAGAAPLLAMLAVSLPLTAMTAPLTAVMKARDHIARAFYCDLGWAISYIALLLLLGRLLGLAGTAIALVVAGAVQLSLALRLGGDALGERVPVGAVARAATAAAIALAPAAAVTLALPGTPLVVRALLLPAGVVLFRAILLRLGVLTRDERDQLRALMASTGPGRVAGRIVS